MSDRTASGAAAAPLLGTVVSVLETRYHPSWAEDWDAVGLVLGDPDQPIRRVLLAVDPVDAVVDEALAWGADLVVTHHPLFLRPVHGIAATTPKGRRAARLARSDVALHVAHTNADVADPGVSDALAAVLGVAETVPLRADPVDPLDKLVTFVPHPQVPAVIDALAAAGAGTIGSYSRCAWTGAGVGTFRPDAGAAPAVGAVGTIEEVAESRVEMVLPRARRRDVLAALRAVHPYEEPAYDVLELAAWPGRRGLGRVGRLDPPLRFADFLGSVAQRLPATPAGLRAAGNPDRLVERVAVCGGAGDGLLESARSSGADVFVTADLRHHPAGEALERGGLMLVDAAHWATEQPWLARAAHLLRQDLAGLGATVDTSVSTIVTDPWEHALAAGRRPGRPPGAPS